MPNLERYDRASDLVSAQLREHQPPSGIKVRCEWSASGRRNSRAGVACPRPSSSVIGIGCEGTGSLQHLLRSLSRRQRDQRRDRSRPAVPRRRA